MRVLPALRVCYLNSLNLGHSLNLCDCKGEKLEVGKELECLLIFKRKWCFDCRIKLFFKLFVTLSALVLHTILLLTVFFLQGQPLICFTAATEIELMLGGSKCSERRWLSNCVLQCIPCHGRPCLWSESGTCALMNHSQEEWLSLNT